ncbi:hypothetical protein JTE90_009842 [Oedothorax gibbosus]|uniref:Uncharacterized protein n=1 Tax=Oedothorax gibbosus TaxID=931172 RepID=A0AAV6TY31_9ARAC|nr:hypothetical protein JTE90_009842 [Oedothorax gibbosus]
MDKCHNSGVTESEKDENKNSNISISASRDQSKYNSEGSPYFSKTRKINLTRILKVNKKLTIAKRLQKLTTTTIFLQEFNLPN